MKFEKLVERLQNNESFEDICDDSQVECFRNYVYYDNDFEEYILKLDAYIATFFNGNVVIKSNNKKYYVPYDSVPNRFGNDLPNEMVMYFNELKEVK